LILANSIMMNAALDLHTIDQITGSKLGTFDVACPWCGPGRRRPANQRKLVLRVWRLDPDFATFHCVRCGEHGYACDDFAARPDPIAIERARARAAEREQAASAERLSKARWLWSTRRPISGSIAETYLREARCIRCALPATLGFLPARGEYPPAMIATFGIPGEPEPGVLAITDDAVCGVHVTRLAPDGSSKAETEHDKIMVGKSVGWPIVLAPVNDLLGLAVTEGIEDALTVFQTTGVGAWAAGSASRLPALADKVPSYVETVTILAHADEAGQDGARKLADALVGRGIEVFVEGLAT
jgi:hypothetical protein